MATSVSIVKGFHHTNYILISANLLLLRQINTIVFVVLVF